MDYAELCKRLRNAYTFPMDTRRTYLEAADAIEELVIELDKASNSGIKTSKEETE